MKQFEKAQSARTGFTLIEVLIGIIVLGLGLLGLAAVFPAVVVQQRQASDAIEGETLVESAKAYLRSSVALTGRAVEVFQYVEPNRPKGLFRAIREVQPGPTPDSDEAFGMSGTWERPIPPNIAYETGSRMQLQPNGDLDINIDYNYGSNVYPAIYRIPLTDRLIPSVALSVTPPNGPPREVPPSVQPDPRFVWDFMLRRNVASPNNPSSSDTMTAAVFVRRLDGFIRRNPNQTLAEMFANRQGQNVLLPVSASPDNGESVSSSREARTYSWIQVAALAPSADNQNFQVDFANEGTRADSIRKMIAQVGQKLVSRTGIVHTVTKVYEDSGSSPPNALTITVEPQFLESERGNLPVFQIWFTPQVPVAVEVFDVTVG